MEKLSSKEIIVDELFVGKRLDMFATDFLNVLSRSYVKNLIEDGKILVDGKIVKAGHKLKIGEKIEFLETEIKPLDAVAQKIDFSIVYEDEDLVVVDKPQGLVVHPCQSTKDGTLVNGLLDRIKNLSGINGVLRPGIVHRLDKNTSGLMIVAKNDFAHVKLAEMIANKTVSRQYLALLKGVVWDNQGVIETYLARDKKDRKKYAVSNEGKLAISNFKVVKRFESCTLVEFSLITGRTHQIRVHASYIGHPVVGDNVYGTCEKGLDGQLLHSYHLFFLHPRTGKEMEFVSALPDYFQRYIDKQKPYKE